MCVMCVCVCDVCDVCVVCDVCDVYFNLLLGLYQSITMVKEAWRNVSQYT